MAYRTANIAMLAGDRLRTVRLCFLHSSSTFSLYFLFLLRSVNFHCLDLTCIVSHTIVMCELHWHAYLAPVVIVRDPSDNGRLNWVWMPGPEPTTCPQCDCAAQWAAQRGEPFVRCSPDQHQLVERVNERLDYICGRYVFFVSISQIYSENVLLMTMSLFHSYKLDS